MVSWTIGVVSWAVGGGIMDCWGWSHGLSQGLYQMFSWNRVDGVALSFHTNMKTNIIVFCVSLKIASSKATGGKKEWQREI